MSVLYGLLYTLPECSGDADFSGDRTSARHVTIPMYNTESRSDIWLTLSYNEDIKYTFQHSKQKYLPAWCGYLLLLAMLVASLLFITASLSLATSMDQEVVNHALVMLSAALFIISCILISYSKEKIRVIVKPWLYVQIVSIFEKQVKINCQ